MNFWNHPNFRMEDFLKTFCVVYDLLYNDVIEEKYEDVLEFDEMCKTENEKKEFLYKFNEYRRDICSSDRECASFILTCRRYDWHYNGTTPEQHPVETEIKIHPFVSKIHERVILF